MRGPGTDWRLSQKSAVSGGPVSPSLSDALSSLPPCGRSGSTFTGAVPEGVTGPSVFRQAARALGFGHLTSPRAAEFAYALIAVSCAGFLGVLLASRHGGISTRMVARMVGGAHRARVSRSAPLLARPLRVRHLRAPLGLPPRKSLHPNPSVAPHDPFYPYNPWTTSARPMVQPSPISPRGWSGSSARLPQPLPHSRRCPGRAGWPPCSWRQGSVVDGVRPGLVLPLP